jgi:hypothetical protein
MSIRLEQQFRPGRIFAADKGQPAVLSHGDVGLLDEAEHIGVETQGLVLVVHQDARDHNPHLSAPLLPGKQLLACLDKKPARPGANLAEGITANELCKQAGLQPQF